jgi:hypothetical protein
MSTCRLCGRAGGLGQVLYFNLVRAGEREQVPVTFELARPPERADVVLCPDCVRGVKRIPFSALPGPDDMLF